MTPVEIRTVVAASLAAGAGGSRAPALRAFVVLVVLVGTLAIVSSVR